MSRFRAQRLVLDCLRPLVAEYVILDRFRVIRLRSTVLKHARRVANQSECSAYHKKWVLANQEARLGYLDIQDGGGLKIAFLVRRKVSP